MQDLPSLRTPSVPGPNSRTWLMRAAGVTVPMGPKTPPDRQGRRPSIVFARASGSNVWDVDGNRFVDLAAGFGSLLLGHCPPAILRAQEVQGARLMQAMGDLYSSDARIALSLRLAELVPGDNNQVILGLSGADAITAALKTAVLATGRAGVLAFDGAYHGLSYAPLAACGLRESYREPFAAQLNSEVSRLPFPLCLADLEPIKLALNTGSFGAILVEPIMGRGGVHLMPAEVYSALHELSQAHGALLIADEIWTGLGRSGSWLHSEASGVRPELVCLGKGLGGGIPISACIGRAEIMMAWCREAEVVHTSTYSGAPLACAAALATLDALVQQELVARSKEVGDRWRRELCEALAELPVTVRGAGLMIAVDCGARPGAAATLMQSMLGQGYIVSTGGGAREVVVLTPPLNIDEALLQAFTALLPTVLRDVLGE